MWKMVLCLQADSFSRALWEILGWLCKGQVSLSRAERWGPAQKWLLVRRVAVCYKGTSESGPGLREISIFLELKTVPDTKGDHERAQKGPPLQMGLFSDTGDLVWQFSNQSLLVLLQHTCFRGCLRKCYRGCVRLQQMRGSSPPPQRQGVA